MFSRRSRRCERCGAIFTFVPQKSYRGEWECEHCRKEPRPAAVMTFEEKAPPEPHFAVGHRNYICGWCSDEPFVTLFAYEMHLKREHPGAWRRQRGE